MKWQTCIVLASVFLNMFPCTIHGEEGLVPFNNLSTLKIAHTLEPYGFDDITIHFNDRISTVIDTLYSIVIDGKIYDDYMGKNRRLIKTRINRNEETEFFIDFSEGMSVDPHFIIYRIKGHKREKLKHEIPGTKLIVPGDGFLYASGHTNNTFDARKKFRIDGDTVTEVRQPFYYVGLVSKTNREIKLWADPELRDEFNLVTTLPTGTKVTVLLKSSKPYPDFSYLIKTESGLVGWVRFKPEELYMWTKPNPIEGLFYKGD